jgi:hypothetical protein
MSARLNGWPVACLLVILGFTACTRGPKGLSRGSYAAIEKGLPILERVYEYRDGGAMAFDPRMLDAEHALDEIRAAGSNNANDASAWLIFQSSVGLLKIYRQNLESLIDAQGEHGAEFKKVRVDRLKLRAETSDQIAKGIALLRGYLY